VAVYFRRNHKDDEEENTEGKSFLKSRAVLIGGGLALVLVIFAATILLGGDTMLLRSVGVSTASEADPSSGRLHFWQTTLQIIAANPFLGVGLNAFGVAFTRYDTWSGFYRVEQAHNEYLQILAEAGVVGLLLAAAFIYFLFRRGWQVFTTTRDPFRRGVCLGAMAACFGILIHSIFDFPLRTPSNFLTFLIIAALATVYIHHPKLYRKKVSSKQ
jgi:O-antigen ligase